MRNAESVDACREECKANGAEKMVQGLVVNKHLPGTTVRLDDMPREMDRIDAM